MSLTSLQLDPGHSKEKKIEMDPAYLKQTLPSMPLIGSTPFKVDPSDNSMDSERPSPFVATSTPATLSASTNLSVTVASDLTLYADDINITICGSTLNGLKLYPTPIVIREAGRTLPNDKDASTESKDAKLPAVPDVPPPVLRTGRSGSKLALALKQSSQSGSADPNDTGQDNEDEMAALMAASSTIKGNKKKQFPQVPNPAAIRKKKLKELKDAQLLLTMVDPETEYFREENRKNLASAFFYLMKDRMEENKDTELLNEVIETMTEFDATVTPVTEFYNRMTGLLQNYPELAKQFISFLLPEQAWECGKFLEYIKMENMRKFVKKIKAFFAKQPQLFRLVFAALENLSDNENVTVEEVKSTIIPLLKGNSVLIDSFLMLIPQGRPPESLMSMDVEDMDFDSDNSGNEEEKLILPNQPDVYGNDHCICFCHESTDDKFRTRFFHCVSCGTRFIQGRVYLQTARHSRLANVTFPEDECQAKRIYLKKIPPKARGRRVKKPPENRENVDATQDPTAVTPDAANSSSAKDPATPDCGENPDPKRCKISNGRLQKSAARSLDMSPSIRDGTNYLTNDTGVSVVHLSDPLCNQSLGIYSLDQEFVTLDAFNHNRMLTEGTNVLSDLGCRMVTSTLENVSDGLGTFDYNTNGNVTIENASSTSYGVDEKTLDLFDLQGAVPLANVACVAMDTYDEELGPIENSGDFITLEVYNSNVEMGTLLNVQSVVVQESHVDTNHVESVLVIQEPMDTSYVLPSIPVHQSSMEVNNIPCAPEKNDAPMLVTSSVLLSENQSVLPSLCALTTKTINVPVATILDSNPVLNATSCDLYKAPTETDYVLRSDNNAFAPERLSPEKCEDIVDGAVTPSTLLPAVISECEPETHGKKKVDEIRRPFEDRTEIVDDFPKAVIQPENVVILKNEIMSKTSQDKISPIDPKNPLEVKIGESCGNSAPALAAAEDSQNEQETKMQVNLEERDGMIMQEATRREPLPWTKDEDKVILLEVQRGYCLEKTFQNMTGLPERSLAEIQERFQLLMKMLQEMTHPRAESTSSDNSSSRSL